MNKRGLKGNVYKLKERHYLAKMHFGNIVPDTSALYTGKERVPESINPEHAGLFEFIEGPLGIEYNEDLSFYNNGFIYRDINLDDNGIKSFDFNEYDDKNRLLKQTSASQINNIKTAKDTSGSIWYSKSSEELDSFVYQKNTTFQYTLQRILKDSAYYLSNKTLINDKELVNEEITYQRNGDIFLRTIYEYDELGRNTLQCMYDSINTLEKIITSYENNTIIFRRGDSKTIKTYADDKHNKLIKREVFYNDKLMNINQYQYDSLGNVVSWEDSDFVSNIFKKFQYQYEFDHKENWIKRIKYQVSLTDNELTPKEITNRKISYYPEASFFSKGYSFFIYMGSFIILFLLITPLVFLISYVLYPLKIKYQFENKAFRYTTYAVATIIWIIIGAFSASLYCTLYEHNNIWTWLILILLFNSIIIISLYAMYDILRDRLRFKDIKIVNDLILTERRKRTEITKVELVHYFALKCAFLAFIAFGVYMACFFLLNLNPIKPWEHLLYVKPIKSDIIWMIISSLLSIIIFWRIEKYISKDKIPVK